MSNEEQRHHAGRILDIARDAVTTVRGAQHGSLNESFDMIAEMWSVYINHAVARATGLMPSPRITLTGADVLRMMGQMKQARSVWGDPLNVDNYVDEAGYSSLTAAYLGVVTPPAAAPQEQPAKKTKVPPVPIEEEIPAFLQSTPVPESL